MINRIKSEIIINPYLFISWTSSQIMYIGSQPVICYSDIRPVIDLLKSIGHNEESANFWIRRFMFVCPIDYDLNSIYP